MSIGSAALIVFGRLPRPGAVKTRLVPHLSELQASRLYEAFVLDSLESYSHLDLPVRLYLPEEDVSAFDLPTMGATLHTQRGAMLGDKLLNAFVDTFSAGFARVVVIGSDHPTLPIEFVELAFAELESPLRVVLGPATDGGFYLLGMNDLFSELFLGDSYSHSQVFQMTLDRADDSQADVVVLPEWFDIDRPEDLVRLDRDLADGHVGVARTREVVTNLAAKSPQKA